MKKMTTMITRILLAILLVFAVSFSASAQGHPNPKDNPNTVIPAPPAYVVPAGAYFTTTDNEDNALSGNPDGDMDVYLYNGPPTPIEFNIFVDDATVTSAQLSIYAYDIDWGQGEVDQVYINGHFLGSLTGVNDTWSTSVFNFDPSWVVPGPSGKNLIQIYVDVNDEGWAVRVDWGQIVTNNTSGTATFRYVNLDKATYCEGECVQVEGEVDADPSMPVTVQIYLVDPNNNSIAQENRSFTATTGDEPFTASMCLPSNPMAGTWKIRTICYNANNVQEDIEEKTFTVNNPCTTTIPTLSQWGLIALAVALLAVGTAYILRRRNSNVSV